MKTSANAHAAEMDRILDGVQSTEQIPAELFKVVDLLDASPTVLRALADPAASSAAREGLVASLISPRVGTGTAEVVTAATRLHWSSPEQFADALERQAVRAELRLAEHGGGLEAVNEELFRFERIVAGDSGLRDAIENRNAPRELRERLVDQLLGGRVGAGTIRLAKRALSARRGKVSRTLEEYLELGAALAQRRIARVTVAQPLTDEQHRRLQAALTRLAETAVELQVEVDPQVLGGMRVQIGDQIIEGTVSGRLEDARRQIA